MIDSELLAILEAEEGQCEGRSSSVLSEERRKAIDYFNGELPGHEAQPGRSGVVSTEVADTILWIMPSLMRIFTAGDDVVEFEPNSQEDEDGAKQATDYVNWVLSRQSPASGFTVLYDLIFDALLQKNGFAKAWWEEREITDRQERTVNLDAALALVQQLKADGYEIDKVEDVEPEPGDGVDQAQMSPAPQAVMAGGPSPMMGAPNGSMMPAPMPAPLPQPKMLIKASRTKKQGKVRIANIPPEEVLVSRRARQMADAPFIAHKTSRSRSDLIADGYPKAKVEKMTGGDAKDSQEEQSRRNDLDPLSTDTSSPDPAMREVDVTEAYILIDHDNDGIAERRQVIYGGKTILSNEPWEGPVPIITATPIRLPHRVFGRSMADLVMDLQLIKSTLWRQTLDNLYLSNNPRSVISDKVNIDDLLTVRPGGLIRLKDGVVPKDGHVMPLEVPFVAGASFPMLEYVDAVKENRTGVTRYNQGTDANSLNKTASGINQIQQAANQRIELIARILAETGIKDLFRLILFLVNKHVDKAQVIRLRNKWVEVDPSQWRELFDVRIDVALGTGNRDQMLSHLTTLATVQQQIAMAQQGMSGPLVTWEEVGNTSRKMAENMGFKNPEQFIKPFGEQEAQQWSQQQQANPPPNPDMMKVQAQAETDKAKLQMDGEAKKADLELRVQEMQSTFALESRKLEMEMAKLQAEIELKRQGAAADQAMSREKMQGDLAVKREAATQKASTMGMNSKTGTMVDVTALEEGVASALETISSKVDAQEAAEASRDEQMLALLREIAAPKEKRISVTLPSGAPFEAVIGASGQISGSAGGRPINGTVA